MDSRYCSMSLCDLKLELKKRNAKQSGRKKELIERLEAYDRNFNFGKEVSPLKADYSMTLPDSDMYMDLKSDKKIPLVSMKIIDTYLCQFNKTFDETPIGLYKEKHLCYLRIQNSESLSAFFAKIACRAEMRKSVLYVVDLRLSTSGNIEESQCECGAGMGPTAHCKHVCAVLYGLYVFCKSGSVSVEHTCTEKLQSFHRVRKHTGSPVKARDLKIDGADESTNIKFDPRPEKFRKHVGNEDHFRNTCLKFQGISNLPIFQMFPPANFRAVVNDHDYLEKSMEEHFLEVIGVHCVSDERLENIEKRTRGQISNDLWLEERNKRIQSSNFGRICKALEKTDKFKLAKELLKQNKFSSKATSHGIKFEKVALKKYEEMFMCKVKECGIFVSKSMPFLGSSPDGIISKDVLLEIKCPYTARDKYISPQTVPYMKQDENGLNLNTNHNYYYQVQGQLFCAGAQYCDFFVFTTVDTKCVRIERDNNFLSSMTKQLALFYSDYFKPALLEKHFYREV